MGEEDLKLHLLVTTEQYFFTDEQDAADLIEKRKENTNGYLIEHKVSEKTAKSLTHYIVTLKTRFATLAEMKERHNG